VGLFDQTAQWLTVGAILVMVAVELVITVTGEAMRTTFQGILAFVRRLAPDKIIAHEKLLSYLLNLEGKAEGAMGTSRSIIHNSVDGIVSTDAQLMVETVNGAIQRIFRFAPEQLLGQHAGVLFSKEASTKLSTQSEAMLRGEAGRTYTENMECRTDSGEAVPCSCTLLGIQSGKSVGGFVVIFRDISERARQAREATEAKARNEQLLYEILPRAIVSRLNQGETDINFVVESASISFIDIQAFSDFAAQLTPQETLTTLSGIFNGYDTHLPKYPLVTKMKLIGDVYMLAAGLFTPEAAPAEHAASVVHFGLDCLQVIEDTNTRLDTSLCVRVGVNSGGPIIAGVLGREKPLFDILGDPINVAARLQSTDEPGKIQISEETYSLVRELEFSISPRGMVFLKGKGERPAYLVTRQEAAVFSMASFANLVGGVVVPTDDPDPSPIGRPRGARAGASFV
jgi:PAS domain S-box-containing protein